MEQKKIEKLIWDISAKTKIPDIPDKKILGIILKI